MMKANHTIRFFFVLLMLAGAAFGCQKSDNAAVDNSPTDVLAERFSEPSDSSAVAVKETVTPQTTAAASQEKASQPVPEPKFDATAAAKTEKAEKDSPAAKVQVQVTVQKIRTDVPNDAERSAELAAALPRQEKLNAAPHRMHHDRNRERFHRGPGMWRLYARLTEGERRELQELQCEDPDRYRLVIQQKLDALYAEDVARREELRTLIRTYQETVDPEQKADLKRRMTLLVRSDFQRRLSENRLQFEDLRARAIKLERELDKRAANAEAIVAHQVDGLLSGQIPLDEPPGRPRRMDAPPRAMRPGRRPPPPPESMPETVRNRPESGK